MCHADEHQRVQCRQACFVLSLYMCRCVTPTLASHHGSVPPPLTGRFCLRLPADVVHSASLLFELAQCRPGKKHSSVASDARDNSQRGFLFHHHHPYMVCNKNLSMLQHVLKRQEPLIHQHYVPCR